MRKTQNFLRRAGSAALALTLTVSLCQPAFAATKAPFSKDETVYAVMAADGSVTKTTVSEHLYNADGLAGVEDKSTLKNIVNTESFAEYTRNGDTLVWNTDDTDVYYKGDTDRQLPISARVTYTLDGRTAPLSELLGQSGHLVLTIDLTNHETGKVTVNGTIAPLIELGAGFDMDLTARENIYLNGTVLGFSPKYLDEKFDEIVEFSELENFLDVPLKNYSSGMVARIGFAIATITKPDILIADEVLSVGDFLFQQKCEKRMQELMAGGTTVILVSHSIEQIERMCTKVAWLSHGHLKMNGDTQTVCAAYKATQRGEV